MTAEIGTACDCCGASEVVIAYPLEEIHGYGPGGEMIRFEQGTWGVCSACRPLVEARDLEGLVARADATYGAHQPAAWRQVLRQSIRNLYRLILERRGEAVPVGEWREWVA